MTDNNQVKWLKELMDKVSELANKDPNPNKKKPTSFPKTFLDKE